jgi:hypothetical protein
VSENGFAGTFDKDCLYFYDQTLKLGRTAAEVEQGAELFGSNAAILECPLAALVVAEEPRGDIQVVVPRSSELDRASYRFPRRLLHADIL